MITLFRRIRENLIAPGSVPKYMLYATGEILLVVVGILIALQVNNWNEQRKDRQTEYDILNALKVEFEANLADLQEVIGEHKVIISELQDMQQITVNQDYENERLDSLMYGVLKWWTFTDRPGASSNLINSGNLNLLSNKELRDLITQWSGIVADVVDDELFTQDFLRETVQPFLAANFPVSNLELINNEKFRAYDITGRLDIRSVFPRKNVDWESFLNNEEFQNLISIRIMHELQCVLEGQNAEKDCLRILELINQQLNVT